MGYNLSNYQFLAFKILCYLDKLKKFDKFLIKSHFQ